MDNSDRGRIEELIQEEISLAPYNEQWPSLFEREVRFLREQLPKDLIGRVEHFGSTAVPGLSAKPIIDILVEVTSLDETRRRIVPIMQAAGYEYFWRPTILLQLPRGPRNTSETAPGGNRARSAAGVAPSAETDCFPHENSLHHSHFTADSKEAGK